VRRSIYSRADRLLLVSAHLASDPLLSGAVATGRAVIVPNGVDIAQIRQRAAAPIAHPVRDGAIPYLVSVGRLVSHKNFPTLIRAFARAAASRPMTLLIIGGGTSHQREQLEALAASLGVADSVRLEGEMDNPMPLVAGAAAFVLPSLWEGASNALLEALALEVPIVASRSAGNAQEVLGDGRYGLLVDPLDIDGMAQALLQQTSTDACRPGNRAADFSADDAIARVCQAIVELAVPRVGNQTRHAVPEGT
jgi:glycosyltransferase involved in cell wall biosynthesis